MNRFWSIKKKQGRLKSFEKILILLFIVLVNGCVNSANSANENIVNVEEISAHGEYIDTQGSDERKRRIEVINSKPGFMSSLEGYNHQLNLDDIPDIDFSKQRVVMVGLGIVGGSERLDFVSAVEFEEFVKFTYKFIVPCGKCVAISSAQFPLRIYILDTNKRIVIEEVLEVFGAPED